MFSCQISKGCLMLSIPASNINPYLAKYSQIPDGYCQYRQNRDGDNYHLTIIPKKEMTDDIAIQLEPYLGESFPIIILGLGNTETSYYLICYFPDGDLIRHKCNLPLRNFHITLGFDKVDDHHHDKDLMTLVVAENDGIKQLLTCHHLSNKKWLSTLIKLFKKSLYNKIDGTQEYDWWYQYVTTLANLRQFDKVEKYMFCLNDLNPFLGHFVKLKIHQHQGTLTGACILSTFQEIGQKPIPQYQRYKNEIQKLVELMNHPVAFDDKNHYILTNKSQGIIPKVDTDNQRIYQKAKKRGLTHKDLFMNKDGNITERDIPTPNHLQVPTSNSNISPDTYKILAIPQPRNMTPIHIPDKFERVKMPQLYGAGFISDIHLAFLEHLDFDLVLNLSETRSSLEKVMKSKYHYHFIMDRQPPTVEECIELVKLIDTKKRVIVHCIGGRGRTSVILVAYLIWKLQVPKEEVLSWMKNRKVILSDTQDQFLTTFQKIIFKSATLTQIELHGEYFPNVIMLMGLPASGKSTFAQHLVLNCPNCVICLNQDSLGRGKFYQTLTTTLSKLGQKTNPHLSRKDVSKKDISKKDNIIPYHQILIIDKCHTEVEERKNILDMIRKNFHPIKPKVWCFWFDYPLEELIFRSQKRENHPTLSKEKCATVIKDKYYSLTPPALSEGFSQICHVVDIDVINDLLINWKLPIINCYDYYFFKYPRTKHWINNGAVSRDDLILTSSEANQFLNQFIYVEEKIDGANFGISIEPDTYAIRYQNRSRYVNADTHEQFSKIPKWESAYGNSLYQILEPGRHILFGEWLYMKHSIFYDKLPSYFVAFDLFDKKENKFYSRDELVKLLSATDISIVPLIFQGSLKSKEELIKLMNVKSQYGSQQIEGLYLKIPDKNKKWTLNRAKIVRSDFITADTLFWTRNSHPNELESIE